MKRSTGSGQLQHQALFTLCGECWTQPAVPTQSDRQLPQSSAGERQGSVACHAVCWLQSNRRISVRRLLASPVLHRWSAVLPSSDCFVASRIASSMASNVSSQWRSPPCKHTRSSEEPNVGSSSADLAATLATWLGARSLGRSISPAQPQRPGARAASRSRALQRPSREPRPDRALLGVSVQRIAIRSAA